MFTCSIVKFGRRQNPAIVSLARLIDFSASSHLEIYSLYREQFPFEVETESITRRSRYAESRKSICRLSHMFPLPPLIRSEAFLMLLTAWAVADFSSAKPRSPGSGIFPTQPRKTAHSQRLTRHDGLDRRRPLPPVPFKHPASSIRQTSGSLVSVESVYAARALRPADSGREVTN